jgi:hypothetical protein
MFDWEIGDCLSAGAEASCVFELRNGLMPRSGM